MKYISKKIALILAGMSLVLTSCFSDLDRFPVNDVTGEEVYRDVMGFKMALAKVYGAMILTGNAGPAGMPDIAGIDEGFSGFTRTFFNLQVTPTDEAFCNWGDAGVADLNHLDFTALNPFSVALYNRALLNILYANHFMRQSDDAVLAERGFSAADRAEIAIMRAEARFIRAFLYWVLMDIFGNPPFIDETMLLGVLPTQKDRDINIGRPMLFRWIESELLDIVNNNLLRPVGARVRGRVCEAAAWALLARLYLNANVYNNPVGSPESNINTSFYTQAIYFANRVISSGAFQLSENYEHVFLNDNRESPEIIWGLIFDGAFARTFSGTTFLINASSQGAQQTTHRARLMHFGIFENANWAGYRVRYEFLQRFDRANDRRFLFVGPSDRIGNATSDFEASGMATFKFRNIPSRMVLQGCDRNLVGGRFVNCTYCGPNEGCNLFQRHMDNNTPFGNDHERQFADNSFPLFRLAEMHLIYAEAAVRSGSNMATAEALINQLQARAGLPNAPPLTLDWILDERARELFWEGHRRTDLVRFNRFTSGPSWEWRGGEQNGIPVSSHFNVFPLSGRDIMANRELQQNPGY